MGFIVAELGELPLSIAASTGHMEDCVGILRILRERLYGLGGRQDQQVDVVSACFALDFLHHWQSAIRSGANDKMSALPRYVLFDRQRRVPKLVLKPLRGFLLAFEDLST